MSIRLFPEVDIHIVENTAEIWFEQSGVSGIIFLFQPRSPKGGVLFVCFTRFFVGLEYKFTEFEFEV